MRQKGDTGEQGPQGAVGPVGPQGEAGSWDSPVVLAPRGKPDHKGLKALLVLTASRPTKSGLRRAIREPKPILLWACKGRKGNQDRKGLWGRQVNPPLKRSGCQLLKAVKSCRVLKPHLVFTILRLMQELPLFPPTS